MTNLRAIAVLGSILAGAMIVPPASAQVAGDEQAEPFFDFSWIACEQRIVSGAPRGACEIAEGTGEPSIVFFVSPVMENPEFVDIVAFLGAVEPVSGIAFRHGAPTRAYDSPAEAETGRTAFLAEMQRRYGTRFRSVAVAFDRPPAAAENEDAYYFPEERYLGAHAFAPRAGGPLAAIAFLQAGYGDLERSTATTASLVRTTLAAAGAQEGESQRRQHRAAHLLVLNYMARVGQVFPRFNMPLDFAPLLRDLGEEGVRPPIYAEWDDGQYVQIAFLRHLIAGEPAARARLATYAGNLQELEETLSILESLDPAEDAPEIAAQRARVPALLDALEASFAEARGPFDRLLAPEQADALAAALESRMDGLQAEAAIADAQR